MVQNIVKREVNLAIKAWKYVTFQFIIHLKISPYNTFQKVFWSLHFGGRSFRLGLDITWKTVNIEILETCHQVKILKLHFRPTAM